MSGDYLSGVLVGASEWRLPVKCCQATGAPGLTGEVSLVSL